MIVLITYIILHELRCCTAATRLWWVTNCFICILPIFVIIERDLLSHNNSHIRILKDMNLVSHAAKRQSVYDWLNLWTNIQISATDNSHSIQNLKQRQKKKTKYHQGNHSNMKFTSLMTIFLNLLILFLFRFCGSIFN